MARGSPDYLNPSYSIASSVADMSSLFAAQFGSAMLDGLGRVVWLDKFNSNLAGWVLANTATASAPAISVNTAYIPPSSVMFYDAGPVAIGISSMSRLVYDYGSLRMGFEFSHWLSLNPARTEYRLERYIDGVYYRARLRIHQLTGLVEIEGNGVWQTIVTISGLNLFGMWLGVKMTVDFESAEFVRLVLGNSRYDLSAYSLTTGSISAPNTTALYIRSESGDNDPSSTYCGHVILTVDEP